MEENGATQASQVLYRVYDSIAQTSTVVMAENLKTLARNYVLSYEREKLAHLKHQILIKEVGIIDEKGYVTGTPELANRTLVEVLELYNKQMEHNMAEHAKEWEK